MLTNKLKLHSDLHSITQLTTVTWLHMQTDHEGKQTAGIIIWRSSAISATGMASIHYEIWKKNENKNKILQHFYAWFLAAVVGAKILLKFSLNNLLNSDLDIL